LSPYFLPYQRRWIQDASPLKILEKSRQTGISFSTAYSAVKRAAAQRARLDVWVSSRDEVQARLFLEDCQRWAEALQIAGTSRGEEAYDPRDGFSAYVLRFLNGRAIYSLSSNPNSLAGKRGHVILDEFALHGDQRLLYRVAKPVTTWGGQLEIISTHRGANSVFNQILTDIKERGNPMGWSHHRVTIQDAVAQGLAERINLKTGRDETLAAFLARLESECLDAEQWLQEYCCVPSDESTAFLTYEMITACEADCLKDFAYLEQCENPLFLGIDVGRRHDLTIMDVGEKIGDVVWDRLRLELANAPFSEQERELYRLLHLPRLQRACIDASGLGMQLAERAREQCGWKVEPVTFTAPVKEELAWQLRTAFEERLVRVPHDDRLLADLRGVKKEITSAGNTRFGGESADSHCDRFWAKALRQQAARYRADSIGAAVA